jgi:hypothetical protein
MYHLQKSEKQYRTEITDYWWPNSAISGKADIDKVSYNYFTKAILNNRIKKRGETIVHLNYSTFRIKL